MNQLPQEVYDLIVAHIESAAGDAKPTSRAMSTLATVSVTWQRAVEIRTFRKLNLKSSELEDFARIVTGARRTYLRILSYHIILPTYELRFQDKYECHLDRDTNDVAFTAAIYGIFHTIKSWETQGKDWHHARIELVIAGASSPTDKEVDFRKNTQPFQRLIKRYSFSYLRVLDPDQLPSVGAVRALRLPWLRNKRRIAPQTCTELATKLPNLDLLEADLPDDEVAYPAMRRLQRNNLTQSIERCLISESIKTLAINLVSGLMRNQHWRPMTLLPQGTSHDPLSSTLWNMTRHKKNLNHLYISGVIDSNLLWRAHTACPIEPFWQNLTTLHIDFQLTTPCGQWYFRARDDASMSPVEEGLQVKARSEVALPPGYKLTMDGEDEENIDLGSWRCAWSDRGMLPTRVFRLIPDEKLLEPLIDSFARACQQIPSLANAHLETTLNNPTEGGRLPKNVPSYKWGIYYATANQHSGWYRPAGDPASPWEDISRPRLTYNTSGWRPCESVMALLRGIGHCGDSIIEQHVRLNFF
jgi:hypothetical protein